MSETGFFPRVGPRPLVTTNRTIAGVAVFVASESIFFLAVVLAYVAYRDAGLATAKANLDFVRTALFSIALFASSGSMALAAGRREARWLLVTIALGVIFLAGQGSEYARLLGEGIGPGSALFGTTFFTLTGLHGLHVLAGLAALGALLASVRARPRGVSAVAWEAVGIYWHFVDAVWVVVFSVVYIGTIL
jgi:heme/copper-type cytochrome/quinol oxidase subunit 3